MGEARHKQEMLAAAEEEMKRWGDRPLRLDIDITTCLGMIGALQLALRHPGFQKRPSADVVRKLVFAFIRQIPPDYPALKKLMELGFHQRFDC